MKNSKLNNILKPKIYYVHDGIKIKNNKIIISDYNSFEFYAIQHSNNNSLMYVCNNTSLNNEKYIKVKEKYEEKIAKIFFDAIFEEVGVKTYTIKSNYKRETVDFLYKMKAIKMRLNENIKVLNAPKLTCSEVAVPNTNRVFEQINIGEENTIHFKYYDHWPIINAKKYNLCITFPEQSYDKIENIPNNAERLILNNLPMTKNPIKEIKSNKKISIFQDYTKNSIIQIDLVKTDTICELYTGKNVQYNKIICHNLTLVSKEITIKDIELKSIDILTGDEGIILNIQKIKSKLGNIIITNMLKKRHKIYIEDFEGDEIVFEVYGRLIELYYKGQKQSYVKDEIIIKKEK